MKSRTDKKRFHLPLRAYVLYLVIISVILTGVTLSRYTASSGAGDAARVAVMRNIKISETGNFAQQNKWIITPGVNMIKNATVRFDGSEMACYVFVRIKTTGWQKRGDYSFACSVDGNDVLTWRVDEAIWKFLYADGDGAVYYAVVGAKKSFEESVLASGGTINVSSALTKTQLDKLTADFAGELSIDIEAKAMQYHGVEEVAEPGLDETQRAVKAWNIVKNK